MPAKFSSIGGKLVFPQTYVSVGWDFGYNLKSTGESTSDESTVTEFRHQFVELQNLQLSSLAGSVAANLAVEVPCSAQKNDVCVSIGF